MMGWPADQYRKASARTRKEDPSFDAPETKQSWKLADNQLETGGSSKCLRDRSLTDLQKPSKSQGT